MNGIYAGSNCFQTETLPFLIYFDSYILLISDEQHHRQRCQFCHNPDTWNLISQKVVNAEDLLKQALRYRSYWSHEGGITISGCRSVDMVCPSSSIYKHQVCDMARFLLSQHFPMQTKMRLIAILHACQKRRYSCDSGYRWTALYKKRFISF